MNPFSPTRNFVMHQPVTALTVRILILLLLAVPLVLLCRKAAEHAGYAKRRAPYTASSACCCLAWSAMRPPCFSVCGFAPVGIPLEPLHVLDVRRVGVRRRTAPAASLRTAAPSAAGRTKRAKTESPSCSPSSSRPTSGAAITTSFGGRTINSRRIMRRTCSACTSTRCSSSLRCSTSPLWTLPLWDVFVRGRRTESAMPSASRREPV